MKKAINPSDGRPIDKLIKNSSVLVSWPVGDPKEKKMWNTQSMESEIELETEDTMVERKTGSEVLEQMTQLIGQLGKWKPE